MENPFSKKKKKLTNKQKQNKTKERKQKLISFHLPDSLKMLSRRKNLPMTFHEMQQREDKEKRCCN